ncbi:MAG: 3-phosphoshikimate 1-carboxyvinyltransferase [Coriobacteriia bacterium]|nr:3-phosphoshikimate 1-carboxyvinyltransferase [Coriobacteriia bacterium]
MQHIVEPPAFPARGTLRVPGDKSISHRAVLLAAMAEGTSRLHGVLGGADVRATIGAVRALGAEVVEEEGEHGLELAATGWGERGPSEPAGPIDCGNSGTTARLLAGVLAPWPVTVTLVGDESLSRRPMRRVTRPLVETGARFELTEDGTLPMTIRGAASAIGFSYDLHVASAQVKSAVLLAGCRAEGRTLVTEPAPSRDHTERMLPAFGVPVGREGLAAWVDGPVVPAATELSVPADPSSAAFMAGAALMHEGGEVTLPGLSVNPTRTGFLRVMERMGARVEYANERDEGGESVADVTVARDGALQAAEVAAEEVPSLVDEVPLLAVVATQAEGTTRFRGVEELRLKESDRLDGIVGVFSALYVGAKIDEEGTLVIVGRSHAPLRGDVALDSRGDHRLAMAYAVAALAADATVGIDGFECVEVSYPRFAEDLASLVSG